jgi:phenylpropionate dioxygenase-like ring-hydroxylating dioxygenase large terminal subunit
MKKEEQIKQLKLLMKRLDDDTNVDAGFMLKNPASAYTCPDLAQKEWDTFFRGSPQLLGLTADLPEPGSFLTTSDFGVPVLATRDSAGVFRAFLNVCRHRGVTLEAENKGKRKHFSCPFHGWTYANDGKLVSVPKENHFGKLDKSCHGLIELPAEERYGFLFVHPDPNGALDVDALLGGLAPEFESWGWGNLLNIGHDTYDMPLNWKLTMDTFGETYHFTALHKNTLAQNFYGNVQCYDTYGQNHRMILCTKSIDELRGQPESTWEIEQGSFPVYYLFPNVQLNISQFGMIMVRAYPDPKNAGRSISRLTFYSRAEPLETFSEQILGISETFATIIRDEDYTVASRSQLGAESGLLDHLIFGRNEPALHHYHNTYRAALGMEPLERYEG